MGYTTDFWGKLHISNKLDKDTESLINGLGTRRMARDVSKLAQMKNISVEEAKKRYGIEGEFYYNAITRRGCR
jgi:hypothetical protein